MDHLPSGCVPAEVSKVVLEPCVDLVEAALPLRRVEDRLPDQRRVRERRTHVVHLVELSVLGKACNQFSVIMTPSKLVTLISTA